VAKVGSIGLDFERTVVLVNHLFFVDQMIGFADQLHQRVYISGPVIQDLVGVALCGEIDDSEGSVDFCPNCFVHN